MSKTVRANAGETRGATRRGVTSVKDPVRRWAVGTNFKTNCFSENKKVFRNTFWATN